MDQTFWNCVKLTHCESQLFGNGDHSWDCEADGLYELRCEQLKLWKIPMLSLAQKLQSQMCDS